jgi:hypothetical protein
VPDKPPRKPLELGGFAGFAAITTGRRKVRWSINPPRAEARAGAEAARFSSLEAEIMRGIGRKPERTDDAGNQAAAAVPPTPALGSSLTLSQGARAAPAKTLVRP